MKFIITRTNKLKLVAYAGVVGAFSYGMMYLVARGTINSANDMLFQLEHGIDPRGD